MCKRAAPVHLFGEGLSEEAATPEFPGTRRSAFLKTLPVIHPREPPVTASSATVASRFNATHACTVSTVLAFGIMRNGKLVFACAETVEDETSLWKGKEKWEEIPDHGFTRMSTYKSFSAFARGLIVLLRFYGSGTESRPESCPNPWPESVSHAAQGRPQLLRPGRMPWVKSDCS